MSRMCEICAKKPLVGHKVSHSNIKTKKRWLPNLQSIVMTLNGTRKRVRACVSCIKTYTKKIST